MACHFFAPQLGPSRLRLQDLRTRRLAIATWEQRTPRTQDGRLIREKGASRETIAKQSVGRWVRRIAQGWVGETGKMRRLGAARAGRVNRETIAQQSVGGRVKKIAKAGRVRMPTVVKVPCIHRKSQMAATPTSLGDRKRASLEGSLLGV